MTTVASRSGNKRHKGTGRFTVGWMPAIFVWLWSTGFIGAKYGLPYAEPFTLLLYRMLSTLVVLGVIAWWLKSEWPTLDGVAHTAITGLLVHGLYLGGVFYAIEDGMPAGVVSIIVGLQPLATAAVAVVVLREAITIRQWSGLVLGLIGVSLVILEKMGDTSQATGFPVWALLWALIALGGISFGTVYQKRYCQNVDLVPGAFIQYCAASVLFALGAFALESREVSWNMQLILATGWLVLGLSVGAILLLMQLIRRGAASNVASLFYLVPPVTALQAYILFDERLGVLALCGGLLSVLGVALVIIKRDR